MKKSRMSGFTLIELVIVIAILGILAGIAIPRFMDAAATARGAKMLADMRTIESAATIYYTKTGAYSEIIVYSNGNVESTPADCLTKDDASNKKYQLLASMPIPLTGTVIFPCKPDTKITITSSMYVISDLFNESGHCGLTTEGSPALSDVDSAALAEGGKGW